MTIGSHTSWGLISLVINHRSILGNNLLLLLNERAALAEETEEAIGNVIAADVVGFSDLGSFHTCQKPAEMEAICSVGKDVSLFNGTG